MHNLLSHLWKWSSENALHRLNNNHACGQDEIAGKLWKYSAGVISVSLESTFQSGIRGRATFGLRSRDPHSSVETWQSHSLSLIALSRIAIPSTTTYILQPKQIQNPAQYRRHHLVTIVSGSQISRAQLIIDKQQCGCGPKAKALLVQGISQAHAVKVLSKHSCTCPTVPHYSS